MLSSGWRGELAMGSALSGSFLVLSVSLVGILFTSILLLAYYLFLACSCRRRRHSQSPSATTTHQLCRGLEEAAIRRIPTLRYQQQKKKQQHCGVCLAEFREGERLRRLPPCLHSFHIDCIDAWLAAALTCPLCRAHVDTHSQDHAIAAAAAAATSVGTTRQPPDDDDPLLSSVHPPMRRSLSLDSCADNHLYLALRTIILHHQPCSALLRHPQPHGRKAGVSARTRTLRRSFFSFSHARTSPVPILPI